MKMTGLLMGMRYGVTCPYSSCVGSLIEQYRCRYAPILKLIPKQGTLDEENEILLMHFQRAITALKIRALDLGAMVEEQLRVSVRAIEERDEDLAQRVFQNDDQIDNGEVEIEEECLKMLALYHPVAEDLRFIVAVLKINNDLERIGDVAVNIAERAVFLANRPPIQTRMSFSTMAEKVQQMLKMSLDALVDRDTDRAYLVIAADDEVDALNRQSYIDVQDGIMQHPRETPDLLHLLSVSRHLERIGDLATSIAEEVIYLVRGEIVRHRLEDYLGSTY